MTPTRLWITALVTLLAVPGLAQAQTCASNGDCAQGLTCQVDTATVTPTPACPAGTTCPSPPPPTLAMTCLPALCSTDGDCGQDMVCHSSTTTTCSGVAVVAVTCDPNAVCPTTPTPPPPACTDTTIYQCAFKWQLPCNADVDCGEGFLCRPTTMGTCSGAAPVADGGASPPPVCVTTTSFPGSCQAKVASCTSDSDCPSNWKCADANATIAVGGRPAIVDAGATQGPATATATLTTTATLAKTCQSPNASAGRPDGVGTTPTVGYNASPDGGATTKGTTTPPTTVQSGGETSTDTKTSATLTRGGCALGGGATPSNAADMLSLLGLLGAVGLLRLRRGQG